MAMLQTDVQDNRNQIGINAAIVSINRDMGTQVGLLIEDMENGTNV